MAIPAKSRYVMETRPGARAGITLFCAPDDLAGLWARIVLSEKDIDHARVEWVRPGKRSRQIELEDRSACAWGSTA